MKAKQRSPAAVLGELAASVAARCGVLEFANGWLDAVAPRYETQRTPSFLDELLPKVLPWLPMLPGLFLALRSSPDPAATLAEYLAHQDPPPPANGPRWQQVATPPAGLSPYPPGHPLGGPPSVSTGHPPYRAPSDCPAEPCADACSIPGTPTVPAESFLLSLEFRTVDASDGSSVVCRARTATEDMGDVVRASTLVEALEAVRATVAGSPRPAMPTPSPAPSEPNP